MYVLTAAGLAKKTMDTVNHAVLVKDVLVRIQDTTFLQ
jgi:hypothetical protein